MFTAIVLIVLGLAVLIIGAEGLVRGSASIARRLNVSNLVIGLTVVAFGTSAPELIVNILAVLSGSADISIGNIVGSNIFNILLVLGVASIIFPLTVKSSTVWNEIPFALLAMILLFVLGNDSLLDGADFNAITRTDGISLIAIFAIFLFYMVRLAKTDTSENSESIRMYSWSVSVVFTIAGLAGLFFGGKILVENAITLARMAGLSELFIGLTIVAIGTSLPELATSIVAAIHKHPDIAVGNIVGSNIFNVFWVLGLTGIFLQLPFNPGTNIDILVAIGATCLLFLFMFSGINKKLDRWEGAVFIIMFLLYMFYLIKRG